MNHWSEALKLSDDESQPVVITAAGTFDAEGAGYVPKWAQGEKPGTITVPESAIDEMVASFEDGDLGVVPFIDSGGHKEGAASATFARLWKGIFKDNFGVDRVGLFGQPNWTELGRKVIGDGQYGYLSGLFGPKGKDGRMALLSATPTNKPVLRVLPRIALEAEGLDPDSLALAQESLSAIHPLPYDLLALSEVDFISLELTASVSGEDHPATDFAYVPDPEKPGTWKFPIFDKAHVDAACSRWDQADIPQADRPGVAKKIAAAWKVFYPDAGACPLKLEATKGVTMPEDKPVVDETAVALEQANAARIAEQTLALETTNAQLAEARASLRTIQLEADAAVARKLPYDAATIAKVIALSSVTYGSDTIALSEDAPKQRMFDLVVDVLGKAVPVVHTKAEGFVAFEQASDDALALERQKKTARAMYADDPDKLTKVLARLDAGKE